MSGLPNGWCEVSIADVTKPFVLADPLKTPDQTFKYVDIGSIDNKSKTISNPKIIKGAEAPSRARRVIHAGDTLFSTVRTYLKNIALVPDELDGQLTSTGMSILRPNEAIDPKYLFNWASSDKFVAEVSVAQDGTMYPAVSDRDVADALIRVPPLPEQRRIVTTIDSLCAKSRRSRGHLDHIPRLVEKYKQAILAAAFRADLTREWRASVGRRGSWESTSIGRVLTDIRYGTAKKCNYDGGAVGVLRIPNVQHGRIALDDIKSADFNDSEVEALQLVEGDILVIRSNGSLDLVGRSAIVHGTAVGMLFAGYLIRLRFDQTLADPQFIQLYLQTAEARMRLERLAKSTSGVNNINSTQLRSLPLVRPNIDEQQEIVRRIENAFSWIIRLASEATSARKLIDHLDQAVISKAFRGELVPQDPNDEPVSVLLERIRSARSSVSGDTQRKKPKR